MAFFEWCADLFGVTQRSRLGQLVVTCVALFGVGLLLGTRWGMSGVAVPALLFAAGMVIAWSVVRARDKVWRAACAPLTELDGARSAREGHGVSAPTVDALLDLTDAVTAARLGDYVAANDALAVIDRDLLREEEAHLLEAVRALVSIGLGDTHRAAQQAAVALPTGAEDIDAHLGRTLVADAWNEPARLRATITAWNRVGVHGSNPSPLGRLERLVRLRIDPRVAAEISSAEARDLAGEARAIGDEELAIELDARARASAYR